MAGFPIIPISFFGEVVSHTDDTLTIKPGNGVTDAGEKIGPADVLGYLPDKAHVYFHADPVTGHGVGGSGDGESGGNQG